MVRLRRDQIAAFVGNDPEAIRQIEKLFTTVSDGEADGVSAAVAAGLALAAANEALAAAERLGDVIARQPVADVAALDNPQAPACELAALMRAVDDVAAQPIAQQHVTAPGAVLGNVRSAAATTSVNHDDFLICVDASGGGVTINLPSAAASRGRTLAIKKIDASLNAVTINGAASETINGSATYMVAMQYAAATIICDGATWWTI